MCVEMKKALHFAWLHAIETKGCTFSPNLLHIFLRLYRVTHMKLTSFEWVVLIRKARGEGGLCQCVISTRWCHSAHCKPVNAHCSKHVSRHLISRFGDVPWPPRSPDLSTCDFFFFGVFWNRVFALTNPVRWMIWRKPSVRKFVRSIVSCLARVVDDF